MADWPGGRGSLAAADPSVCLCSSAAAAADLIYGICGVALGLLLGTSLLLLSNRQNGSYMLHPGEGHAPFIFGCIYVTCMPPWPLEV